MIRGLILGIGNPLRSDDGAGAHVVDRVAGRLPPGVEARAVHQLTPELAEALAGVDRVAFVDASTRLDPGVVDATGVEAGAAPVRSHHATPEGLLELCRLVYGRAPRAHLLTVGVASLEHGEALSPPVRDALGPLCRSVFEIFAP